MDYRKMLAAYIEWVRTKNKGKDFLGQSPGPLIGEVLTAEESIELGRVRDHAGSREYRRTNLVDQIARLEVELAAAIERGSANTTDRIKARIAEKTAALEKLARK